LLKKGEVMAKKLYTLNEQGQALLKTLVDPYSSFYIDAVLDLEEAMRMRICRTLRALFSVVSCLTKSKGNSNEKLSNGLGQGTKGF
jgi:hypothetical protein